MKSLMNATDEKNNLLITVFLTRMYIPAASAPTEFNFLIINGFILITANKIPGKNRTLEEAEF